MKTEAERQLATLVAMPTLSDDIEANDTALDYIEAYLKQRGMHCVRDRFDGHGTLVASTRPGNAKTPAVLLAGHVDVMPASEEMFSLREEGGRLIGRGVYDMKFALAGYLQWVDDHQATLADYDVAIMITTDEEYGSKGGISGTKRLTERGMRPQVCLLPDSTAPGWTVEKVAKGFWRFDLIATGRTAHGSRPWEGDSASFKLVHALHDIKTHFANQGPQTDTLNIGVIHGGKTYNQIPSRMKASLEMRLLHDDSFAKQRRFIQHICKQHDLTLDEGSWMDPVKTDLNQPLIQAYRDSVGAVTGTRSEPYISCGQSDAIYFINAGVPCILSCPEGGRHHSEEEWISRTSFLQFVPILNHYLDQVAKTPVTSVDTATMTV